MSVADPLTGLFDLSGRTALITGASRGIGALAARALDSAGARVVLCARDAARLEHVAAGLRHDPVVVTADLADRQAVPRLLAALGTIEVDVLVNNAATSELGPARELTEQSWDRVQDLNLRSVFLLSRALASPMAERGWGKIVNVASILGRLGDTNASAYVTSKAALLGLTKSLGVEWARSGITVNALSPGWIDTDMIVDLKSAPSFDRRVTRRTPAGRWGAVDDLAGAFVFLSSRASDFMVGQELVVDGGVSASW